jgi:hypothetical protein
MQQRAESGTLGWQAFPAKNLATLKEGISRTRPSFF